MASRAGRIVRKTLRWSLRIGLVLILTVLALAVLLLYSPGFLHVVINVGLGFYNDRIPGEIRIGRVEGRLADHLVLGDIYLEDGDGRALVVARELTLDWSPWDLLDGKLTASSLTLHDAQVHLVAGGGFGDLATPGPAKPPRETIAPTSVFLSRGLPTRSARRRFFSFATTRSATGSCTRSREPAQQTCP